MRRQLAFVVFLALVTTLIGSAHYLIYLRVAQPWGSAVAGPAAWLLLALAIFTPVGIASSRWLGNPWGKWLAMAAYLWFGLLVLLLTGALVAELVRLAVPLLGVDVPPQGLAAAVLSWGIVAGIYGVAAAHRPVRVVRRAISLARFPEAMAGFKLVQLSDLHIGPILGRVWLEQIVATVNQLDADAVVITGDLVDGSVRRLRDQVAPLANLKARHGVYFVTGNHEYYSGADPWCAELVRLGIKPLRNERVALGGDQGFDLAGVDDWNAFGRGHGRDLPRALAGRDATRELVLLAHQPRQIQEAAEHGVGLQLSGHTHGGQIFPWNFAVRLQQPYVAGLVQHQGTQLYISRGTGYWGPPMRLFAPAEITLLALNAG